MDHAKIIGSRIRRKDDPRPSTLIDVLSDPAFEVEPGQEEMRQKLLAEVIARKDEIIRVQADC